MAEENADSMVTGKGIPILASSVTFFLEGTDGRRFLLHYVYVLVMRMNVRMGVGMGARAFMHPDSVCT